MRRHGVMRALAVLTVTVLLVGFGTGCTKYASEEDLQNLENQKQAALSAEKKVDQLKSEKADLEQQKAAKQAELKEVQAEKATVADRLAKLEGDQGMQKSSTGEGTK